ncbi:DNA internalization-related competence protein ComEC/Rec2 [Chloroflexota bacterium]
MPLIYLSCAWLAGIFWGSRFSPPLALILIGLAPLPLLFFLSKHRQFIILTSLCLITFFGGVFCFQSSLDTGLQPYNDRGTVEVRGIVDRDPEVRDKVTHLHLRATEIRLNQEWQEISGTVLLFVPRYPAYNYGDVLLADGNLETPPQLDGFDYQGYLAHQGIYSTMLYPKIETLDRGKGSKLLAGVYRLRNRLSLNLAKVLPEPQASLAQGIILGLRGNIPLSLKEVFSRTGTAHLLAISGLHLSIVAGILLSLGLWLFGRRRYLYVWLALVTIWLYALITGMYPPVVRAAIMASLFLMAELLGRQRSAITALALAAAVMVGISPQILWDAAFQLSFLAMAGLIFIFPRLQLIGRKAVKATIGEEGTAVSIASIVTDSFSVTLGAILAVWPVIAHYFGIVSFAGPLATFLALPALPAIIITGTLAGSLGFFALPLAQAAGWLAWLFLSYLLLVVRVFAAIPLSSIEVGAASATLLWVYYPALAATLWLSRSITGSGKPNVVASLKSGAGRSLNFISRLPRQWVIPPLLVVAMLTSVAASTMPDDKLHVSFLNVGEGDAILIQTPAHQDILVDGGPSPQAIGLELGQKMPFWDRTIDLLVLTHPHADHVTGLVEAVRRYKVKQVLYPDLHYTLPVYDQWLQLIREKEIKRTVARAGQQVDLGSGAVIEVLNPQSPPLTGTESDIDNNGMVLRLSMGDVSFLLTADIMSEAEFELITRRANLTSTVLKVPHHGSDTSTTTEFLAVVSPRLAVISAGKDNRFGHPSEETLDRLKERIDPENIYRTDEHGAIEFITDGKRLWVKTGK